MVIFDGHGFGFGGGIMWLSWISLIVVILWGIKAMSSVDGESRGSAKSPFEILRDRFGALESPTRRSSWISLVDKSWTQWDGRPTQKSTAWGRTYSVHGHKLSGSLPLAKLSVR
jgi:hypothetical protein